MPRTFYRIVKSPNPTASDFTSDQAKGIPAPSRDPLRAALHDGISVFATEQQARRKTLDFDLGGYIAALEIPEGAPISVERTLPGSRGHHTLRGAAAALLACVAGVVEV